MDRSVNKIIRNITSSIIAIVTMFSLIVTMGLIFFKTTLINENTYKTIFEKVGTYDKVLDSIESNVNYVLVLNGIKSDTLDGIISKKEIVQIMDNTTDSFIGTLKGDNYNTSYDINTYKDRVNKMIHKYIRDNNMYLNEVESNDIEEMKNNIVNIIDSELQIINFESLLSLSIIKNISKIINILDNNLVLITIIVINILLLSIFFIIWKTRKVRGFAWIGYTVVSSGFIVFLISFSGYLSDFYEYSVIAIPHVAEAVGSIIKTYLLNLSTIGIVVVIIGMISMSVYWKHLYRRYYSESF